MKYLPNALVGALLCCGFASTALLAQRTAADRSGINDIEYYPTEDDFKLQTEARFPAVAAAAEAPTRTDYSYAFDAQMITGEYLSKEELDAQLLRRRTELQRAKQSDAPQTLAESLGVEAAFAKTRVLNDVPTSGAGPDPE